MYSKLLVSIVASVFGCLLIASSAFAADITIPVIIDGKPITMTVSFDDNGSVSMIIITTTQESPGLDVVSDTSIGANVIEARTSNSGFEVYPQKAPRDSSDYCDETLEDGEIVEVIGQNRSGTWTKINLYEGECWVKTRQLDGLPEDLPIVK